MKCWYFLHSETYFLHLTLAQTLIHLLVLLNNKFITIFNFRHLSCSENFIGGGGRRQKNFYFSNSFFLFLSTLFFFILLFFHCSNTNFRQFSYFLYLSLFLLLWYDDLLTFLPSKCVHFVYLLSVNVQCKAFGLLFYFFLHEALLFNFLWVFLTICLSQYRLVVRLWIW